MFATFASQLDLPARLRVVAICGGRPQCARFARTRRRTPRQCGNGFSTQGFRLDHQAQRSFTPSKELFGLVLVVLLLPRGCPRTAHLPRTHHDERVSDGPSGRPSLKNQKQYAGWCTLWFIRQEEDETGLLYRRQSHKERLWRKCKYLHRPFGCPLVLAPWWNRTSKL
jgi:hypothetical protein